MLFDIYKELLGKEKPIEQMKLKLDGMYKVKQWKVKGFLSSSSCSSSAVSLKASAITHPQ